MQVFEWTDLFASERRGFRQLPVERAFAGGAEAASQFYAEGETVKRHEVKQPIERADRKVGSVGAALQNAYFMPHRTVEEINEEAMADKMATIYYDPMARQASRF